MADCVNDAIAAFNSLDPPVLLTSYDAGEQSGTPLDVIKEEQRLGRFVGTGGTATFMGFAYGCSAATLGEISRIQGAMGGPTAFAQWVAERTGETFGVNWHRDLGMWGIDSHHESVLTAGLFPFEELHFTAAECPLLARPVRVPTPRTGPRRWVQLLRQKVGYPGLAGPQFCALRDPTPNEEILFRDAYRSASSSVPPQRLADDFARLTRDREWLGVFWSFPGMADFNGRFSDEFADFVEHSRGSRMGGPGEPVELPPSSIGRVPADAITFGSFFSIEQCPWHPNPL